MAEIKKELLSLLNLDIANTIPPFDSLTPTQQKVLEVVQDSDFATGSMVDNWRKTQELLPLADYLVEPKSILNFLCLREVVLNELYKRGSAQYDYSPSGYLDYLVMALKIIPMYVVSNVALNGVKPGVVLEDWFEDIQDRKVKTDKFMTLEELSNIVKERRSDYIAATFGKWRDGFHGEHIETLRLGRHVLGENGLYILFIESKEAILARLGVNTHCLNDDERVRQATECQSIDRVCVVNPGSGEEGVIENYYRDLWAKVSPDYYIFGSSDDTLTNTFIQRGKELGTIVLWARDKGNISTSKKIKDIKQRGLK